MLISGDNRPSPSFSGAIAAAASINNENIPSRNIYQDIFRQAACALCRFLLRSAFSDFVTKHLDKLRQSAARWSALAEAINGLDVAGLDVARLESRKVSPRHEMIITDPIIGCSKEVESRNLFVRISFDA